MDRNYITNSRILKALADENRLRILSYIKEKELNAGELLSKMNFGQSTLSHHMKILTTAGVVKARRAGKCVYYSINQKAIREAINWIANSLT